MSSNAKTPSDQGGPGFEPKDTVQVSVGRHTANLYPKLTHSMSVEERAHGFHVTVAGLEMINIDVGVLLETLGHHCMCSALIDSYKAQWRDHFEDHWLDWGCLEIVSFHDSSGTRLADATTATDPRVLKPVQDGQAIDCRPNDVKYVRLLGKIDYTSLIQADNQKNKVLRMHWYVELPQGTQQVRDGAILPNNRTIHTWLGASDLRTMSKEEMETAILSQVP